MNSTSAVLIIIKALSALSATAGAAIAARQQCQRPQTCFHCCFLHFLDPYHCVCELLTTPFRQIRRYGCE